MEETKIMRANNSCLLTHPMAMIFTIKNESVHVQNITLNDHLQFCVSILFRFSNNTVSIFILEVFLIARNFLPIPPTCRNFLVDFDEYNEL